MPEIAREKWWKELTDAEKIQRLREVVRNQANTLHRMRWELDCLLTHSHADGKVVAPILDIGSRHSDDFRSYSVGGPDEDWL